MRERFFRYLHRQTDLVELCRINISFQTFSAFFRGTAEDGPFSLIQSCFFEIFATNHIRSGLADAEGNEIFSHTSLVRFSFRHGHCCPRDVQGATLWYGLWTLKKPYYLLVTLRCMSDLFWRDEVLGQRVELGFISSCESSACVKSRCHSLPTTCTTRHTRGPR